MNHGGKKAWFVSVGKLEKGTKKGFKIRERLKVDETKMEYKGCRSWVHKIK
jgi:hypothetical protein